MKTPHQLMAQRSRPAMTVEYKVVNPATGETESTHPTATDAEIGEAIARTQGAFAGWSRTPVAERARLIHRVADLYAERIDELAALITREMGKTTAEATGEIEFVVDIYRYYADNGRAAAGRRAAAQRDRRQRDRPQDPDRPAARDHAVELPLLPGRPVRRPEPDGRQHDPAQARPAVPRVGAGDGAALPGRRSPGRRLRQHLRHQRAGGRHHRRPPGPRGVGDRKRAGRRPPWPRSPGST